MDEIETLTTELNDQELGQLHRVSIMGVCRLFLEEERTQAAAELLTRYIEPSRSDRLLYFLEPLIELHKAGALEEGPLLEFCAKFQPPSSVLALEWLRTGYRAADDADHRNFQRFVIEPLYTLAKDDRNLMDIRFSPQQRSTLQAVIKSSVVEERPLSLIRLGDGESYPYPVPEVEGLKPRVFDKDSRKFELHWWGASPPPGQAGVDLVTRFRLAVARCDILGFPSVYRIIRNMTPAYSRYGKKRNERAFIKILGALGKEIPVGQRLFTEERCHRIRGAIDEPFLIDLAAMARSIVLVSHWKEIRTKFPHASSFIRVPKGRELFKSYPEIIERVREVSGPGTIVLVGAGQIAKILVDEARQLGAVALDVGSLMDYMVERKTRTIADVI